MCLADTGRAPPEIHRAAIQVMWSTQTAWFDVAIVATIFAIGNIAFGHFEEHKGKPKRVLKVVLVTGVLGLLSAAGLRWVTFSLIALMGCVAVYVHAWWLPRHGINGWTAEPKDKYYDLLKVPYERRPAPPSVRSAPRT